MTADEYQSGKIRPKRKDHDHTNIYSYRVEWSLVHCAECRSQRGCYNEQNG